jgi:hypothetical protein
MQCLKNWWYNDQYYKITSDGKQHSMEYDDMFEYILNIHKSSKGLQYHFIKPGESYKIVNPYDVIGLSFTLNNKTYILSPHSFLIQGNEWNEIFMRWLCTYLGIYYGEGTIALLDRNIILYSGTYLKVINELKNDIK